jgi:hypothetical protein
MGNLINLHGCAPWVLLEDTMSLRKIEREEERRLNENDKIQPLL